MDPVNIRQPDELRSAGSRRVAATPHGPPEATTGRPRPWQGSIDDPARTISRARGRGSDVKDGSGLHVDLAGLPRDDSRHGEGNAPPVAADLAERTRQLEGVRAVAEEIARELDLPTLLELIHTKAAGLVGADAGALYLWDEESRLLVPRAWHGDWLGDLSVRLGEGATGTAAQRLRGTVVNDYASWPHAMPSLLERGAVQAVMAEPIVSRGRLLGVITLNRAAAGRPFTEEDRRLLTLFAGQAAIAVANAQLYSELQLRARQQAAVAELGQRALSAGGLDGLMDEVVSLVARTLEVECCEVLELLPDGGGLLPRACTGWRGGAVGQARVRAGAESQAGYALLSNAPVVVDDLGSETRFRVDALMRDHGVISGVSVIIPGPHRPFGALGAHARRRRRFSRDDVHFVQAVADVLGAAIERKRAEAALRQSEKLAAMGTLLAGVAHELNNALATVVGVAGLLRGAVGRGRLAEPIERLWQGADRCARIARKFLALARQRSPERRPVRLNDVVQEVVELLASPFRLDGVEVRLDLAPGLPLLSADAHQLQQALFNLVANAHQAMRESPGPRRLTLTTRFDPAARRISLAVADTGPGIPPELRERVFEPFFTTKPAGQGTGLGLPLSREIVEGHGGAIRLEPGHGRGAVFRIELPAAAPAAAMPESPAAEAPSPLREKRVLVVDDDPGITELLAGILGENGHRVETAADGASALARLLSRPYDLVLCDLRMPRLDGPDLYRALERRQPAVLRRLVFVTGDTLSAETGAFLESAGRPVLTKPFSPAEVRRVIERVLRAG
jgi:two-component system NtrC family sensor kinase